MNILIDLTFIINADVSIGFTRVALSLLNSFMKLGKASSFILLIDKTSESFFRKNYSNYLIRTTTSSKLKFIDILSSYKKRNRIKSIIINNNIDLLFCPFISARTTIIRDIPMIGILHDVQKFELYKNHKFINTLYKYKITKIIESFDRIITISNSEKKHILSLFPHLLERIDVIHNGISICESDTPIKELSKEKPYILNINTLFKYKNVLVLLKAFNEIKDKIPHILVLKAKKTKYWEEEIVPYIQKNNLQTRIILIERVLSDAELASLYRNADVFVSPSLMEGFGLTPIEASIYGVPIICSNIDTLKESTLGLAQYFNPTEYNELVLLLEKNLIYRKENIDLKHISNLLKKEYSELEQAKKYLNILSTYENNSCNPSIQA